MFLKSNLGIRQLRVFCPPGGSGPRSSVQHLICAERLRQERVPWISEPHCVGIMHLLNFRSLLPKAPVWAVGSRSQRSDGKCSDYEVKTVRCNLSELIPSPAARQHDKQALGHLGSNSLRTFFARCRWPTCVRCLTLCIRSSLSAKSPVEPSAERLDRPYRSQRRKQGDPCPD